MNIPIGTHVTGYTFYGERISGTVYEHYTNDLKGNSEMIQDETGYGILVPTKSLRIIYDNPSMFTLWTLYPHQILYKFGHSYMFFDYPMLG